jgi:hypothetical protein
MEDHRLRMFENRVLSRIFGPEREEVAGDWGRLHNEELHNLYASPNDIRVIKNKEDEVCIGHAALMRCMRNAYNILVGKPEGKMPLGGPRCRWEDNIRMDLRGNTVGRCRLDPSGSGYEPVAGSCEYGNEPWGSIKGGGNFLTS